MDLDSFLTERYCAVDDWWQAAHQLGGRRRVGRRARLSPRELLTPAVLAQRPRWRSERDFWRFARPTSGAPSATWGARAS